MANVKIPDLPLNDALTDDDLLVVEQSNGTKKVPLGSVIPEGGSTGDALVKKSNSDYDLEWKSQSTQIVNLVYPVGSIYMSTANTSPAVLFGGTWEQLKDKFLLGAGDTYTAGDTGGEATHTLTTNEMPSHKHQLSYYDITYGSSGKNTWVLDVGSKHSGFVNSPSINTEGGDQAHNNMPPYLVVYMWKRTA